MPSKAKRTCLKPGCLNLTSERYCERHEAERQRQDQQERGTAAQRGYSSQWRKARAGFLEKHPLCKCCHAAGKITAATVLDHVVPHKGDKGLFWDRENWQPLCKACHDSKTAREDGGFGNKRG